MNDKKKFQAWVDESKVELLDEAIKGEYESRVEWLNDVMNKTIEGKINKSNEEMPLADLVKPQEGFVNSVGLPVQEDKYFMLKIAAEKLGFESVEDWLDHSVEDAIIESKKIHDGEPSNKVENTNKIKTARKQSNFTQTEIAKMVEIDRSYYNLIENGVRLPSMDLISKICRLIGLSLEDFYDAHNALGKR